MLLALAGLDASQLGSKRAVVYSHDKKKGQLHRGVFSRRKTPVVLMISNMFALERVDFFFLI